MIDTVVLTIPLEKYRIIDRQKFNPPTDTLGVERCLIKHVNNPTREYKDRDIYQPRLTVMKRMTRNGITVPLKIEFSVPNLIYGNNTDELVEEDFLRVVSVLRMRLLEMGISMKEEDIIYADISTIHIGKNIVLTEGYTSTLAISEYAKVNLTKRLDLNKTNFRNDGHSLQYYSKTHSMVFYDKIKDASKSKSRAIEKDRTQMQMTLFKDTKRLELLRLEVRLCQRRKVRSVLVKLGIESEMTLQGLFKREIWQKILVSYHQNMITKMDDFIFVPKQKPEEIIKQLVLAEVSKSPKQLIYLTGLAVLAKEMGIRALREVVESRATVRTWARTKDDLKDVNKAFETKDKHGFVDMVKEALDRFEPIRSERLRLSQRL